MPDYYVHKFTVLGHAMAYMQLFTVKYSKF